MSFLLIKECMKIERLKLDECLLEISEELV